MPEIGRASVTPIGIVRCAERYRFEAPRQGVFAENRGYIKLYPGCGYEEAAADLTGFSRIWVIFLFHLNERWNVKVRPPISPDGRRIGVLATRSPHRPNRIGMSCVELEEIRGNRIYINNFDMLDATPVLDIKPYIPAADSFPDARTGWLEEADASRFHVEFSPEFLIQNDRLIQCGGPDLQNFCNVQLVYSPLDPARKRLYPQPDGSCEIGCRTWRIRFSVQEECRKVQVWSLRSNYTAEELLPDAVDRYGDLAIHRLFLADQGA